MLDPSPTLETAAQAKRPGLAVFDFDGTLTHKDSFLPFVRSVCTGQEVRRGLFKQRRAVLAYLLGRRSNHFIKETLVTQYFQGKARADLEATALQFAQHHLPRFLNEAAMECLAWHQKVGHRIVIVSANLELYLQPWATTLNIPDVLATRLAVESGKITGKLEGKSCYGQEKVDRLRALMGDLSQYYVYAYGDSAGDRELLAIADEPFYRSFSSSRKFMIR